MLEIKENMKKYSWILLTQQVFAKKFWQFSNSKSLVASFQSETTQPNFFCELQTQFGTVLGGTQKCTQKNKK